MSASRSISALVDVAQLDRVADLDRAGVGRLLAHDHPKQRRLAGAVRADDPDDPGARQRERQVLDEQPVAVALAQALDLDHASRPAEDRAGWRSPVRAAAAPRASFASSSSFSYALSRALPFACRALRAHAHPFELARERALPRVDLLLLARHPFQLLLEPAGVVAGERDAPPPVELEDPLRDVVQEVAVVRDGDDGAGVFLEEALEPLDRLGVEVVGRLVEEQQVGVLQQQPA